jgi:vacuolar-type H+-ATPase subunit I/STV1
MMRLVSVGSILIVVLACAGGPVPPQVQQAERAEGASQPAQGEQAEDTAVGQRKLIKSVDLTLRVESTEQVAEQVKAITSSHGGYVAAINARSNEGVMYISMSLRVPVETLDKAVASIKSLATKVDGELLKTQDVTDRIVDLEATLRTLETTESELQELLSESRQQGRSVEEIMKLYQELTNIRTRIERLEAQRQGLERQVAFSTINLKLKPTESAQPVVSDRWSAGDTTRSSVRILVQLLQGLTDAVIFVVIVLLPLAIVIGVPAWLGWRIWLRVDKRRTGND